MRLTLYRGSAVALLLGAVVAGATAQPPAYLDKLKADTAALAGERATAESAGAERARLTNDLKKLLERIDKAPPPIVQPPTSPAPKPKPPGAAFSPLATDKLRSAMDLVRANEIYSALNAFRQLNLQELSAEDRAFARFMEASCLRRLGQAKEALPIYREVGDANEDPFVASSAVSQVALLRTSEELQAQLAKLRERPKSR
ncbi:hypothetical protein R5W24_000701 [Gemmata sp. JC717]|uniref:hypothetical protein n=1 Tax=Gemmata algarum TaxID=2975278 RepID=UPI0021BA7562|nr:hypothetical protein [Gemmata algarum]MDY3551623.1 hypothetical protein [Gemmata algarum]